MPLFLLAAESTFVCCPGPWGVFMDREFLLRLAQRVREMMLRAKTDVAREQLRVWAEEFEVQAVELRTAALAKRQTASIT